MGVVGRIYVECLVKCLAQCEEHSTITIIYNKLHNIATIFSVFHSTHNAGCQASQE